ncbi:hypothetical protein RYX36_023033 [Vicia faba]
MFTSAIISETRRRSVPYIQINVNFSLVSMRHNRTSDHQGKEKEEILRHNRTSGHQDKEREETPSLVKVDGISNRHIWRNLNRLIKESSRQRTVREDIDHNLSPVRGLYRSYQY